MTITLSPVNALKSAFKLTANQYLSLLPFIGTYLAINELLLQPFIIRTFQSDYMQAVLCSAVSLFLLSSIGSIMICKMLTKVRQQDCTLKETIIKGLSKTFYTLGAYLLIVGPVFLCIALFETMSSLEMSFVYKDGNLGSLYMYGFIFAGFVLLSVISYFYIRGFVSHALVVNDNLTPLAAINQSARLLKGNYVALFKTLLLYAVVLICLVFCLDVFLPENMLTIIKGAITLPWYLSLIVVVYEKMTQFKDEIACTDLLG